MKLLASSVMIPMLAKPETQTHADSEVAVIQNGKSFRPLGAKHTCIEPVLWLQSNVNKKASLSFRSAFLKRNSIVIFKLNLRLHNNNLIFKLCAFKNHDEN
ncbi:hypothetical protein CHS0354_040039 [Potamilus streckersoni]|uniref:Uncharacterized protein n=1 Tax=Potamilus streckersoni TaxID=2493646 RepID=A0AAE0SSZ4_9BIVA|nr:hypothetical protein CHS0354_040039 [Potamilus streckersoni]